jgi:hypothetical protein
MMKTRATFPSRLAPIFALAVAGCGAGAENWPATWGDPAVPPSELPLAAQDISCGSACTQCILGKRTDILPFYAANGWDTGCGNRDAIVSNWCGIDPAGCAAQKSGACAAACRPVARTVCGKLSGQVLDGTPGFASLLKVCPRVVKWVSAGGGADYAAMAAFKASCPSSKTVLRIYGPAARYATAADLWSARYAFLDRATAAQKASIDYLESDNEFDAGHGFDSPSDYSTFLKGFVALARGRGFRPLIGNIAVGNPTGDVDSCTGDGMRRFGGIVEAIQAAGAAGGGWAYHGYTPRWDQTTGFQEYYALRYRKFLRCYPAIASVPLILTEAGFDSGGDPSSSGYRRNGTDAQYVSWLSWFQRQLAADSSVVGATLFAYGSGGTWPSFQLDPIEASLERIITTCP